MGLLLEYCRSPSNGEEPGYLLYFCLWVIWMCRNTWIFSRKIPSIQDTTLLCLDLVVAYPPAARKNKIKTIGERSQ